MAYAGDVWVPGSRQFKDFEEYLLAREHFAELRDAQALPVAIEVDSERYLQRRLALLKEKLHQVPTSTIIFSKFSLSA